MLEHVLDFLVAAGLDRRSTLVVLGGGVLGDLGGLAAALFMRGIACVQCPTTLLAQVDSSVGGKTAVNLPAGKNLAGAFHQPACVLADTEVLATLPDDELCSGLGEVVKSALVGDGELLALLEREAAAILARDAELLGEVVARCVRVKAAIVARDEEERGERRLLNLGHTFAHAIEHAAGFGRIPHGIAVGVGLVLALRASERAGLLAESELPERVGALLSRLGLPADLAALRARSGTRLAPEEILAGMRHDKKGRSARPAFVLVHGLGRLALDQEIDERVLAEFFA
jgi:3-dehydroquinate synthase